MFCYLYAPRPVRDRPNASLQSSRRAGEGRSPIRGECDKPALTGPPRHGHALARERAAGGLVVTPAMIETRFGPVAGQARGSRLAAATPPGTRTATALHCRPAPVDDLEARRVHSTATFTHDRVIKPDALRSPATAVPVPAKSPAEPRRGAVICRRTWRRPVSPPRRLGPNSNFPASPPRPPRAALAGVQQHASALEK